MTVTTEDPPVWVVMVKNTSLNGSVLQSGRAYQVPKSFAEEMVGTGTLRKPTKAERGRIKAAQDADAQQKADSAAAMAAEAEEDTAEEEGEE